MRLLSRPKGRCCVMVRGCRRAIRALLLYLHHSYHVGFERLARIDGKLRGTGCFSLIPASPDTDTSPVLGPRRRPRAPMRAKPQCVDSRGRGCARPASEGSLDESPSRPDGMTLRRLPQGYRRLPIRMRRKSLCRIPPHGKLTIA